MVTVAAMIQTLEQVDLVEVATDSVEESKDDILDKQREQLLEGKMSTGEDITPSYFDDPYFKTREAAQRYSDWKDEITPNPKRKKGTPNLFINGYYHGEIKVDAKDGEIIYHSDASFEDDIERKYTNKILGLASEKMQEYTFGRFWDVFKLKMESLTNLQFR